MADGVLIVHPLIAEARHRYRRRRALMLVLTVAVVAVAAGVAGTHDWGNGAAVRRQQTIAGLVNDIVTRFDTAFTSGHYAQACALIDPLTGISALNGETTPVGIHGNCEARLAGAARLLGRAVLSDLAPAWHLAYVSNGVQHTGSKAHGFIAAALFTLPNRPTPPIYHLRPLPLPRATIFTISVQQRAPHTPALLTCPPLMCGGDGTGRSFLTAYLSYKNTLAH